MRSSTGVPRRINALCHNSLLLAYSRGAKQSNCRRPERRWPITRGWSKRQSKTRARAGSGVAGSGRALAAAGAGAGAAGCRRLRQRSDVDEAQSGSSLALVVARIRLSYRAPVPAARIQVDSAAEQKRPSDLLFTTLDEPPSARTDPGSESSIVRAGLSTPQVPESRAVKASLPVAAPAAAAPAPAQPAAPVAAGAAAPKSAPPAGRAVAAEPPAKRPASWWSPAATRWVTSPGAIWVRSIACPHCWSSTRKLPTPALIYPGEIVYLPALNRIPMTTTPTWNSCNELLRNPESLAATARRRCGCNGYQEETVIEPNPDADSRAGPDPGSEPGAHSV